MLRLLNMPRQLDYHKMYNWTPTIISNIQMF